MRADPDRIQQVVWNLLSNAVKFTPPNGSVHVTARRDGDEVEISVVDTGIGIVSEFLPHVFDRFRQAEVGTTRAHGGLGLGLSIARQLVELHGGSIAVSSDGEGKGTRFTVRMPLPARNAEAGELEPEPPRQPENDLAGVRVLLVEDEPSARDTLRRLLEIHGAQVRLADTAAAAREAVRLELPDVIVSDVGLPTEDGYSLIRSIRSAANDNGADVPALALTAFARTEDRRSAIDAGFNEHLAKPVDPDRFLRLVSRLVRTGR